MRLLPPSNVPQRVTCFSIRLPSAKTSSVSVCERMMGRYAELFEEFQMAVSWGLSDLTGDPLVPQLLSGQISHEIALYPQGDERDSQAGGDLARTDLQRHLSIAKAAGLEITSLMLPGGAPPARLDALVRAGICMVVRDHVATGRRRVRHPIRTLRFGLWEMQASFLFAEDSGRTGGLAIRRRIDRAMSGGGLCHVVLGDLVSGDRQSLRSLERLLQHVARRRDDGQLQVRTISQIAAQLPHRRSTPAAQSILRAPAPHSRAA